MTARDPRFVLLVAALVLAVVAACSGESPAPYANPGKGVYVPLSWKTDRLVQNHRLHVAREHVACSKCHEIGKDSMGPVTPSRCAECHEKQAHFEHAAARAEARFGAGNRVDCTTCHVFTVDESTASAFAATLGTPDAGLAHPAPSRADGGAATPPSPHVPAPTECARCHAIRQGDTPAVEVHGTSECVKCHTPHEDTRRSIGPCPECHQKITTNHATKGKEPSQACVTCHAHQHAPASDALGSCADCHAKTEPRVPASALFDEGHRKCVGCHRPHDFTKTTAATCQSCHTQVHVLAETRVPAHARCESCHAPHDVRAVGDATCTGCHRAVSSDHPKVAGHTCTSCHDPHPEGRRAEPATKPCSECHQVAQSDSAFHGGIACQKCHTPHRFGLTLGDHSECTGCHQKQIQLVSTLAGHAKCEGCHRGLPHRPTRLEASCDTCHGSIAAHAIKGHSECQSCHEPHRGMLVKECKTCHTVEQRTAPPGHQACIQCHDQHTGSTAASPCGKCHAKEQASFHGNVASGCTSCHRPHGPGGVAAAPACTTCHQTQSLPGLHSVQKHQDCTGCHTAHDKPVPLRAMCLSCHTDRKEHFPDAPSCGSCHLFGPTR